MNKIKETGRSMIEMISVLAVIGVLSAGGLKGYTKAMHKYRVHKSITYVTDAIVEYQSFLKRPIGNYPSESATMAENAQKYELLSTCKIGTSEIAGASYQVCRFALGEVYPRFFMTTKEDGVYYTYMLYATFTKDRENACVDFLNYRWDQVVPQKFWRRGKLWLTSNHGDRVMYSAKINKLNLTDIQQACSTYCEPQAAYCSVVFDLTTLGY